MRITFFVLMLLALSAFAEVMPAASSDYALGIFGNANMDDRIDELDIAYVEGIIKGANAPTNLSDANYDGLIDAQDTDQIQKIMDGSESEITIVDARKRNVTLNVPIQKAVAVNTGALEIIRAIGVNVDDVFVGVSSYAIANGLYWPELKDQVSIAYGSPDYEQLAQLKPDLVILYKNPKKDESFDKYQAIGVPVICMDCFNQEEMDGSIKIFGELFNRRAEANGLIEWYHGYVDLVEERTRGLSASDRPRTLFYNYPESNYPLLKASNSLSGENTMIVKAGGINIAENLNSSSGVAEAEWEWLMSENPDIIVSNVVAAETKSGYSANDTALDFMKKIRDTLLNDSAINSTAAGKNGRIFIICTDLNRGPMQAAGTVFMAKLLHPELFEDLDPQSILKEYYEKWQRIPYHGIYVYPNQE
ncbi:MAG: ABC transporter substrate-binding protein [Methanothrix sp.]|nr:ABC transporter substrate-binding protein [Methanothrix sp.]